MQFVDGNLRPIRYYASAPVFILWYIENCDIPHGFPSPIVRQRIIWTLREQGYNGRIIIAAVAANAERALPHIQNQLLESGVDFYHHNTNRKFNLIGYRDSR